MYSHCTCTTVVRYNFNLHALTGRYLCFAFNCREKVQRCYSLFNVSPNRDKHNCRQIQSFFFLQSLLCDSLMLLCLTVFVTLSISFVRALCASIPKISNPRRTISNILLCTCYEPFFSSLSFYRKRKRFLSLPSLRETSVINDFLGLRCVLSDSDSTDYLHLHCRFHKNS